MIGALRGCVGRLLFLAILVVGLAAAYLYRDRVRAAWAVLRGEPVTAVRSDVVASEALAAAAQDKLDAVMQGRSAEAAFGTGELQSLLLYRYRDQLPAFVDSPRVQMEDGRVRLSLRIPVDRLPGAGGLGEVAALLPDTTDLTIRGVLLAAPEGRTAFAVDGVTAHSIPLPRRLVPGTLAMLGREPEPGLPDDAITLPLPGGARAAYIRGDSIVILGGGPRTRS